MMFPLAVLLALVVLAGIAFAVYIYYFNRDKRLRNTFKASTDRAQNQFDEMWKTLQEKAGVTRDYRDSALKLVLEAMDKRYERTPENALAAVIQEAGVELDPAVFQELSAAIEAERDQFTRTQEELTRIKNEHDNLLDAFPGNFLIPDQSRLEPVYIRSERTAEAYRVGRDEQTLYPAPEGTDGGAA